MMVICGIQNTVNLSVFGIVWHCKMYRSVNVSTHVHVYVLEDSIFILPVYHLIIIYPEYVQNQGQVCKDQCHDQVSHPDLVHFFKISICYLIMTKNIHC